MTDDRDKRRTPPGGYPVPAHVRAQTAPPVEYVQDEVTGNHVGEDLRIARARRSTDERIGRLEDKHDVLAAVVGDVREAVGTMSGQLEVLPRLIDIIERSASRAEQREHVTFTAQVDVDKAGRLATIGDTADAAKLRRSLIAKAVAGVIAIGTSGAFVHWLLERI